MAVPKFNEFFPCFMECLSDGQIHSLREIREYCANAFRLSQEDRELRLPSGGKILNDRVGWARTYLKRAGLIISPERALFKLTDEGKKALNHSSQKITLAYLMRYESFRDFCNANNPEDKSYDKSQKNTKETKATPLEMIDTAIQQLNSALADNLMAEIMKLSPFDFERLVIELLIKIGYGSPHMAGNTTTKKSKDEGIDGTVTSDRFGFDTIYVQAKQWKTDSTIGRPEIQKFLGALAGRGATKGIFISTTHFSKEALEYTNRQLHSKIVLVDGDLLTQLMIEHNLGVTTTSTYEVKQINYAFFAEEN